MAKLPQNTSYIIPRLFCADPVKEVEFCRAVFGAVSLNQRPGPDGMLAHALLTIHSEMIMVEASWPALPSRPPPVDGSSPVVIFIYVEDVDATVKSAEALGAKLLVPPKDQFWGDRTAWIMDPNGHVWTVATRIEETSAEERTKRWSDILNAEPRSATK
ncbi:MAG TPA: VOC family protein [Chthoniobacterales bacterium]|nr:VOC family protein [Chthoniobacterales bacterium]